MSFNSIFYSKKLEVVFLEIILKSIRRRLGFENNSDMIKRLKYQNKIVEDGLLDSKKRLSYSGG